ncbi:hypothetical protein, partial [Pseudomonas sp. FEN]
ELLSVEKSRASYQWFVPVGCALQARCQDLRGKFFLVRYGAAVAGGM